MTSSRSYLLDLPLELRLSIYDFALAGSDAVTISTGVLDSAPHDASSEPSPATAIPGLPADRVPFVRCEYDPSLLSIFNPPTVACTTSAPSKQISFHDSGFFDATEPVGFDVPSLPYPTPLALLQTCHQIHDELEYHIYRRQNASRRDWPQIQEELRGRVHRSQNISTPDTLDDEDTATEPTSPTAASPTAASPTAASPTVASLTAASLTAASPTAASLTAASPTAASPTAATPTVAASADSAPAAPPTAAIPTASASAASPPATSTPVLSTPQATNLPAGAGHSARSSYIHGGLSLFVSYPYGILVLKHAYPHLLRQARKIHICGYFVSDQQKPFARPEKPALECDPQSTMESVNDTLTDIVSQLFISDPSPLLEMIQMRIYYPYASASKIIFQDEFSPIYAAMPYIPNAKINLAIFWGGQTTGIDMRASPIPQGRTTRTVWRMLRECKDDDAPFVIDSKWPDSEESDA